MNNQLAKKKSMITFVLAMSVVFILISFMPTLAKADPESKWINSNGRWWYQHQDGSFPSDGWENINGKWYLFDQSGYMLTGWQFKEGNWYYLNASGAMATGWLKLGATWYFMDSSGVMATGWRAVNGLWYFFNTSGAMQTGWIYTDNNWYYLNSSGAMMKGWQKINGKWYFMNSSGVMVTGWQTVGGARYYMNASGAMQTGWIYTDNNWYYLDSSGAMTTGWQKVFFDWYYMDSYGVMQTGWVKSGSDWYYLDEQSGFMHFYSRTPDGYYLDVDGRMLKPKYSYEVYYLDSNPSYSGMMRALFIRTNNPDPDSISIAWSNEDYRGTTIYSSKFDDVEYADDSGYISAWMPVKGGYGYIGYIEPKASGTSTMIVYEQQERYGRNASIYNEAVGATKQVNVLDSVTEQNKWIDDIIDQYTTPSMTPKEKMDAVTSYLISSKAGFKYPTNHNGILINYAKYPSGPCFVIKRWNSFESPAALCTIANRIGGFSDIHNCYGDYPMGSVQWMNWHHYCRVTYEGKEYNYSVCPMAYTGEVGDTIDYVNFAPGSTDLYEVQ